MIVDEVPEAPAEEEDDEDDDDRLTAPEVKPFTRRVSVRVRSGSKPFSIIRAKASAVTVSSCDEVVASRPLARLEDRRVATDRLLDDDLRRKTERDEFASGLDDAGAASAVADSDWSVGVRPDDAAPTLFLRMSALDESKG